MTHDPRPGRPDVYRMKDVARPALMRHKLARGAGPSKKCAMGAVAFE